MLVAALHAASLVLGQSEPATTQGSNPAVIIIGVLIVTAVVAVVVARLNKR